MPILRYNEAEMEFIYEEKFIKKYFGWILVITVKFNGTQVFYREAGQYKKRGKNVCIKGNSYKEFLNATRTKSEHEYAWINATNNAYSQYFGVRGWNYKESYGILPEVSFKDFP